MMEYVFQNEDFIVRVDFMDNDTFVLPDEGTLTINVRNSAGQKVLNQEVIMNVVKDHYNLKVPATINTKLDTETFAEYVAEVTYLYQGRYRTSKEPYRVIDYIPYSADTNSVRQYFGLNESELEDKTVDMQEVVLTLTQELGETFTNSLKSNTQARFRANRLITLSACDQIFPSLQLRAVYSEGDSTAKYSRQSKIDWNKLHHELTEEIGELKDNLEGIEGFNEVEYSPVALGAVTDPITGV